MSQKNTPDDLTLDDEITREIGFTDGPKRISKFTLRPLTVVSLSWLQRNRVLDDANGDMMQKTAAYAFLHSADKSVIRGVVNHRDAFLDAVDEWMEANISHHTELEPLSAEMNAAFDGYMAASTKAAYPSTSTASPGRTRRRAARSSAWLEPCVSSTCSAAMAISCSAIASRMNSRSGGKPFGSP